MQVVEFVSASECGSGSSGLSASRVRPACRPVALQPVRHRSPMPHPVGIASARHPRKIIESLPAGSRRDAEGSRIVRASDPGAARQVRCRTRRHPRRHGSSASYPHRRLPAPRPSSRRVTAPEAAAMEGTGLPHGRRSALRRLKIGFGRGIHSQASWARRNSPSPSYALVAEVGGRRWAVGSSRWRGAAARPPTGYRLPPTPPDNVTLDESTTCDRPRRSRSVAPPPPLARAPFVGYSYAA